MDFEVVMRISWLKDGKLHDTKLTILRMMNPQTSSFGKNLMALIMYHATGGSKKNSK